MSYEDALNNAIKFGNKLNLYVAEGRGTNGFKVINIYAQTSSLPFTKEFYKFTTDLDHQALYSCTGFTSDGHYEGHIVLSDYAVHIIYQA